MPGDENPYRRIWVSGHRGLVGSAIVRRLERETVEILTVDRNKLDLRDQQAVSTWLRRNKPDAIIVAAAKVGGILANDMYPADFLSQNLSIQSNIIDGAHKADINRVLFLGSSCVYPKQAEQPIREDSILSGPLEPTNEWYAIAKIAGLKLCQAYARQFGRHYNTAMPCNVYGPYDNFDLQTSHVIPALIRKFHQAHLENQSSVRLWGSGTPLREFIYSDDLADAIVCVLRNFEGDSWINCGTGDELSISALAGEIATVVGYHGHVAFDHEKPDGTLRKIMDSSKLNRLGWRAETTLKDGLIKSYRYFCDSVSL